MADVVLSDGTIYTVDTQNPEAEAVAIKGDRIVYVGNNDEAEKWVGEITHVIDLEGKIVFPGFIDCHGHIEWYGRSQKEVSFYDATSYDEVLEHIRPYIYNAQPGQWIFGHGWAQSNWLRRIDGHSALINAKAMALAGIGKDTQDPEGGEIVKDPNTGEPTGIVVDEAMSLITRLIPSITRKDRIQLILKTVDDAVAVGLTGIHDAGVSYEVIEIYKELAQEGRLKIRIYAMLGGFDVYLDDYFKLPCLIGVAENHLTMRSIKIALDGALGSRGAFLLEDYSDRPGHRGLMMRDPASIKSIAVEALRKGFQLNTHAIGDRGNRLILDIIESALKDNPAEDHRFRIEHVQLIALNDIPRFAELGVIPSMQQTHATSDMYWTKDRIGPERVKGNYAWRKILDSGSIIAGGSDFPIESINPLWSFYSAITRQNHDGWPPGGWYPEERMSREEALKSFTIWAAYAAFEEDIKGSITPGKLADMVVLSKDIMRIPPEEILETKTVLTIVGGKIVYQA